ncbi:MAG: alpha/beta hydrolase [Pseudomonadota bacterium]|nr:alpha/beta hydrolase [Pseudomonadota bacterium]
MNAHPAPPALAAWSRGREWHRFIDGSPAVWRFADNRRVAPPLVLLPGALGDASSAWHIAEAFDAQRRVLAVTYPGGCDAMALADGLAALLQALDIGPAAVWGSSYGAWWAQAFAQRHPSRVAALWLGNTFVDGADVAASPLFDAAWLATAASDEVVARWNTALSGRPDDPLRAAQLHLLHHTLPAAQLHGRLRQVAQAPALPPARVPGLVVSDCADDPTLGPAVRERVRARYRDARTLQLPTGGHYPHIVDARPLLDAMRAWLAD